jgi:hypothetical protein
MAIRANLLLSLHFDDGKFPSWLGITSDYGVCKCYLPLVRRSLKALSTAPTRHLLTLEIEKDTKKLVIPDPDYAVWRVHDQHVLTYLVTSLSWEILTGVASNSTTTDMWVAISKSFASQSRPRVLHLRNQLVATRKDDLSVAAYFSTMRGYADEMAAAGKPLDDNDVVSYILNGLDADYNSLIEHVNGMTDSISPETLYSHMLDTEAWLAAQKAQCEHKEQYQLVANAAPCGGGGDGGNKQQSRGGFQGGRGGFGCGNGGGRGNPNNPYRNHQCQVCGKLGHTTLQCWKQFDKNYSGPDKMAYAATSYNRDPAWYADSVATDHITGDLNKLTTKENYSGQEQVHVANDTGMMIKHIGHSIVSTPFQPIHLNNVLHVPQATHEAHAPTRPM